MLDDTPETWLSVAGFDGLYEVSDLGRVRSLDRVVPGLSRYGTPCEYHFRGRVLAPGTDSKGYLYVNLGRKNKRWVHLLVAEAFVGPRPPGLDACHGPGGKTDNRPANLSWGTRAKNLGPDKRRDGTDHNGDRCPTSKLTWEQVDEIRRRAPVPRRGPRPKGVTAPSQLELAEEFGVRQQAISRIVAGKTWRLELRRHAS